MPNLFCKLMPLSILTCLLIAETTASGAENLISRLPGPQCGIFQVTGYLKRTGNNYFILLAPGSRSETQIVLTAEATNDKNNPVILPEQGSFITAKVQINSPVMHYRGSAQKISEVSLAVPNALRADKGTRLKLIKAQPCILQAM